jgi:hypothetical protein
VDCKTDLQTDPICPGSLLCGAARFRDLGLTTRASGPSSKKYLETAAFKLAD